MPKESKSAGGVVLNDKGEVLVVSQHGNSWSLPKGHIEAGEDELAAAKREVYEESGITDLELIKKLGSYERYKIGLDGGDDTSELKTIILFLFKTHQEALKPIDPDNPEARWVPQEKVAELLTHHKDKEFFLSIVGGLTAEMPYLSYLMGAEKIQDSDITDLGVTIEDKKADGDRNLKIPKEKLASYIQLIKVKLDNGFWNEIVGANEIIFIFKFKDGSIKEYRLSPDNEMNIAELCTEFNHDPLDKTANVYRYISGNKFYRDFMMAHYADMINR